MFQVPFPHQSLSSNDSADNNSPESSDLSSTPLWLQKELEEARNGQPGVCTIDSIFKIYCNGFYVAKFRS